LSGFYCLCVLAELLELLVPTLEMMANEATFLGLEGEGLGK